MCNTPLEDLKQAFPWSNHSNCYEALGDALADEDRVVAWELLSVIGTIEQAEKPPECDIKIYAQKCARLLSAAPHRIGRLEYRLATRIPKSDLRLGTIRRAIESAWEENKRGPITLAPMAITEEEEGWLFGTVKP